MQLRYLPPTRRAIWQWGNVKLFGPHQRMKCSGSVQAFHTGARGASKTRVMTSSCWADVVGASLVSAILALLLLERVAAVFLHLLLNLSQVFVQAIEALLPETTISFEPFIGIFERASLEPPGAPLRLAAARDQTGALQDLEGLGDP